MIATDDLDSEEAANSPHFPQVSDHRRPVVVSRRQYSPQVFELRHTFYWRPVRLKRPLRILPRLRLRQPPSLPFRPLKAL